MTRTRTATCQDHCRGCDTHFSSLAAFDHHRQGKYENLGKPFMIGDTPRQCVAPEESEYEYVIGECRVADPDDIQKDVKIWTLAGRREQGKKLGESYGNE